MTVYKIQYTAEIETNDSLEKIPQKLEIDPHHYGTDMWSMKLEKIEVLST